MKKLLRHSMPVAARAIALIGLLWQQHALIAQTIILKDELRHPDLSWPVTLLKYSVKAVDPKQFSVINAETGKPVPFQLQDTTLYLLSDLPSGAQRSFRLQAKAAKNPAKLQVVHNKQFIELNNGLIRIQIPTSGIPQPPILQFGHQQNWLGKGQLPDAFNKARMQVQLLEAGSLTVAYKIRYVFDAGKSYNVIVRLTADMEFAELEETIKGFTASDSLQWQLVWTGLQPNTRYVSTRPGIATKNDQAGYYHSFHREPMTGYADSLFTEKHPYQKNDQRNDARGKLPFRLALYDNWMTWWRLPTAAFWQEKENATSIGLFIKDAEKWNDEQYALWGSKDELNITYHWQNNLLDYTFPLVQGTRSIALAAYPHQKDIDYINDNKKPLAYIDYLRRFYGWISLDKTKDWVLNYKGSDGNARKYFKTPNQKLNLGWLHQSLKNAVAAVATGAERNNGPTPVGARVFYESIVPAFDMNRPAMDTAQYKQLRAWFLFMNYVFMDEGLMPMRTMLSGHPNFLMDLKTMAGLSAFLFPGHPQAPQMADHFEKAIQLNDHFHIRPPVKAWNTQGGRWTENLATYTWAALRPALRTNFLLHHHYDQKNRILQTGISHLGNWLLNAMTSPMQSTRRRGFPPQGAHAQDFAAGAPDLLRMLGQDLFYYDPLLAEHLLWATTSHDKAFEGDRELTRVWEDVLKGPFADNYGTAPQLRSAKYTGYGVVLRSRFGQPGETYVHLQQLDEGPNYRWGRAGGNGVLYYYANGKRYSFNGPEDVGDGPFGDVERCTNFGVKQPAGYRQLGPYRSIGKGDLTAPLYDFGFAQQATVLGANSSYRSRSVLQSGADYLVVFDDVANDTIEGRFSWFTGPGDDFPYIHQVAPGAQPVSADTKGRYYDGRGDFLTVVTHLPTLNVQKTDYGVIVNGEHVFRSDKLIRYNKNDMVFTGTSGIITPKAGALFEGSEIGAGPLRIHTTAGISYEVIDGGYKGKCQSAKPVKVQFCLSEPMPFYVDGLYVLTSDTVTINFPAGEHTWQWSSTPVIPGTPIILGTNNNNGGFTIHYTSVPGATAYEVQVNDKTVLTTTDTAATIRNMPNNTKLYCRVLAKNGAPSEAYPVYISSAPPHRPEGLQFTQGGTLRWGQVLGAGGYKLYRRTKGSWQLAYSGSQRVFIDKSDHGVVYEYAVTAVNDNGESDKSVPCNNDPSNFLNWYPVKLDGFRRDAENHENGFPEYDPFVEDTMPVLKYPD